MPDLFTAKQKEVFNHPIIEAVPKHKHDQHLSRKILSKETSKDNNPLSSFRFYPEHADFLNKDPEEKVILLLRKHPITNLAWVSKSFLMIIVPAFITVFPLFDALPSGYRIISILCWYLLTSAYIFEKFLGWFYQVYIVTDERVFDIDFINLTNRVITDAGLDQIQDVTVHISSTLGTVLNYGRVHIQTAAEVSQLEFEAVPQPDKIARVLRELRVEEEVEKLEGRVR